MQLSKCHHQLLQLAPGCWAKFPLRLSAWQRFSWHARAALTAATATKRLARLLPPRMTLWSSSGAAAGLLPLTARAMPARKLKLTLYSLNFSGLLASSGVTAPVLIQWQKGTICGGLDGKDECMESASTACDRPG